MNCNMELDSIPQFTTETLYCLQNFYRNEMNSISYTKTGTIGSQKDLNMIQYYNALCSELDERGEFD